jgi:hypothetical protein
VTGLFHFYLLLPFLKTQLSTTVEGGSNEIVLPKMKKAAQLLNRQLNTKYLFFSNSSNFFIMNPYGAS